MRQLMTAEDAPFNKPMRVGAAGVPSTGVGVTVGVPVSVGCKVGDGVHVGAAR
jgi:hypothetical protein